MDKALIQFMDKLVLALIPNEVRNPSSLELQKKGDSSSLRLPAGRRAPRNDELNEFSATCYCLKTTRTLLRQFSPRPTRATSISWDKYRNTISLEGWN